MKIKKVEKEYENINPLFDRIEKIREEKGNEYVESIWSKIDEEKVADIERYLSFLIGKSIEEE